jgi:hypothetical protein
LGELAGQMPLLITLSPKISDQICVDIHAVWAVAESFFFCYLWKELLENDLYTCFAINCFVKKHRSNNPSCSYSTRDINFHWMEQNSSSDYFVYLCIPGSETTLH